MTNLRIVIFTILNFPNYKPDIAFWVFCFVFFNSYFFIFLSFLILLITIISCAKILHAFWLLPRDFMLDDTDLSFHFFFFVFWYINTLDFYTLTDLIYSNSVNFVKLTFTLSDSFGFSLYAIESSQIWQFYYFSVILFLVLLHLLGPPVEY